MRRILPRVLFFLAALSCAPYGLCQSSILSNSPGTISTYAKFIPTFVNGASATTQPISFPHSIAPATDGRGGFYVVSSEDPRVYRVRDGLIYVVAGSVDGGTGNSGDGGPATAALIRNPYAVAADSVGNVFIADTSNGRIRKINAQGVISTFANVTARGLALDSQNNLYAASGSQVLKITPDNQTSIVAGNGLSGYGGDGGLATLATLSQTLEYIAVDRSRNLYIADTLNNRVRKVTPEGIISTVAGSGVSGFSGDRAPATYAKLNHPSGIAVDSSGNLYIADYLNNAVRRVDANGVITTIAGRPPADNTLEVVIGAGGFSGDGGQAVSSQLRNPIGVAVDDAGNLYIADSNNYRVRQITPEGIIQTVAGTSSPGGLTYLPRYVTADAAGNLYVSAGLNVVFKIPPNGIPIRFAGTGTFGYSGDGGSALLANFAGPAGLAVDAAGNVYIADSSNNRIRRVAPNGIVTTFAGSGAAGSIGDGGPAIAASMTSPSALTIDSSGNLYFSDATNRVRKIAPNGVITAVAGNGTRGYSGEGSAVSASLWNPSGLAVDSTGTLLIADSDNQRIRKVVNGMITTIAGTGVAGFNGDGPALSTRLTTPTGLAIGNTGNIFFADTNNKRIRKLSPEGIVSTVAGGDRAGYSGDGGPATSAELYGPGGMAMGASGALFVAESFNGVIRRISIRDSAPFSISPLQSVASRSSGTAPEVSSGFAGITPYRGSNVPAGVGIVGFVQNGTLVSETTVLPAPALRSVRIFAEISSAVNTGVAIANPNGLAADIGYFFSDTAGNVREGRLTIPANSRSVAFLDQPPFNGPSSFRGTLTFNSSVPVAVTALRGFTNERSDFLISTLPVIDMSAPPVSGPAWIPHFADGGGWVTQILLINPTDSILTGTVQFNDSSGRPRSVKIDGKNGQSFRYSVPARSSQVLRTSGEDNDTGTGSIRVIADSSSGAIVPASTAIFSFRRNGITVSESSIAVSAPGTTFRFYAESFGNLSQSQPGTIQTGIAIANTNSSAVTVTLATPQGSGLQQTVGSITISAGGQTAVFLSQVAGLAETLSPSYQGIIRVQSSLPISLVGLRAQYNQRGDFLISTIPTANEAIAPTADPVYFPHLVDSGGYTTRLILFNSAAAELQSGFVAFSPDSDKSIVFSSER